MLRRKADFDCEVCVSVVQQEKVRCMVPDDLIHDKGKHCFNVAFKMIKSKYPTAIHIAKSDINKYHKVFAIRGFAGRGAEVKVYRDRYETEKKYCILSGFEIYQRIGSQWAIRIYHGTKKYNDIPNITFYYAPTDSKHDDSYFENPLAEYVEYFGVN